MASISTLNGFDYRGRNYDFTRQGFTTIESMKNFSENYLPPVYVSTCEEDGCLYIYNQSNIVTDETGKWRKFEGGSADLANYFNKNEINVLLALKVDTEVGKGLSTNDFTDSYKDKVDSLENYDDTEVRTAISNNTTSIGDITDKIGTGGLQTTAQTLIGGVNELKASVDDPTLANTVSTIQAKIGTDVMQTTAQTLTGAVNELKTAVDDTTLADAVNTINNKLGNAILQTEAQTITGAINELKTSVDDTSLADRVSANEDAIGILNGDNTTPGSVTKAALDALLASKDYTDEQIEALGETSAILCDGLPIYNTSTNEITYTKDGTPITIDADMIWFYYIDGNHLKQSILISEEWTTIVSAGGVDFGDLVSKSKDVISTYTGSELVTDKIPDIAALQAMQAIIQTLLDDKVSTSDIEDSLTSTSTTKVLSANQGKVLSDSLNTKLDKVFTGTDVANKVLKTDSNGEVTLSDYDSTLDTTSTNAVQNSAVTTAINTKLDKVFTGATDGNKALVTDSNGEVVLTDYDSTLSTSSTNAVQNSTITTALNSKLDSTFTGQDVANKALHTNSLGDVILAEYDSAVDSTSTNAVQGSAIAAALSEKVDVTQGSENANKVMGTDENGDFTLLNLSALGNDAENISYVNTDHPTYTNVKITLDSILAKLYYVEPKVTSFNCTPSTADYEIGTVIPANTLTFTWAVNKDIVSQTLTDCTIELSDRTATYTAALSNTKTFTLTIGDGEKTASASKSIRFLNKIYWGAALDPGTYNSAFILALSGDKLMTSVNGSYNFNVGSGEYGYFAMPQSMKKTSAWVNGFNTELEDCGNISFTNASGNTSVYSIVRFAQKSLGSFTAELK